MQNPDYFLDVRKPPNPIIAAISASSSGSSSAAFSFYTRNKCTSRYHENLLKTTSSRENTDQLEKSCHATPTWHQCSQITKVDENLNQMSIESLLTFFSFFFSRRWRFLSSSSCCCFNIRSSKSTR